MLRGKLIAVEGIDGSGKATQPELLRGHYARNGQAVRRVSFPDYGSISSAVVKLYLSGGIGNGSVEAVNAYAASSFYAVNRYISYQNDWIDDYENGLVIADRYTTSNLIHQMVKLPEEDWPVFAGWLDDYERAKLGLPRPDLVIYLDLPVELALGLMAERYSGDDGRKDIHEKNRACFEACKRAAGYAAERLGWKRIPCSGENGLRSIEEIAAEIENLKCV